MPSIKERLGRLTRMKLRKNVSILLWEPYNFALVESRPTAFPKLLETNVSSPKNMYSNILFWNNNNMGDKGVNKDGSKKKGYTNIMNRTCLMIEPNREHSTVGEFYVETFIQE